MIAHFVLGLSNSLLPVMMIWMGVSLCSIREAVMAGTAKGIFSNLDMNVFHLKSLKIYIQALRYLSWKALKIFSALALKSSLPRKEDSRSRLEEATELPAGSAPSFIINKHVPSFCAIIIEILKYLILFESENDGLVA